MSFSSLKDFECYSLKDTKYKNFRLKKNKKIGGFFNKKIIF